MMFEYADRGPPGQAEALQRSVRGSETDDRVARQRGGVTDAQTVADPKTVGDEKHCGREQRNPRESHPACPKCACRVSRLPSPNKPYYRGRREYPVGGKCQRR